MLKRILVSITKNKKTKIPISPASRIAGEKVLGKTRIETPIKTDSSKITNIILFDLSF